MAVLGNATFRDVRDWYTRLAILERQVCLMEVGEGVSRPQGTGFLVGPDLVMTAYHGLPFERSSERFDATTFSLRFGFSMTPGTGIVADGERFALDRDEPLVAWSAVEDFDLALLRLAEPVGERPPAGEHTRRGWVELQSDAPAELETDAPLAILQHANGGPLKLALNTASAVRRESAEMAAFLQEEIYSKGRFLHRTDTLPGASGSPCFDIDWNFVGLHQGRSFRSANYNFALSRQAIIDWLKSVGLWAAATQQPPSHQAFSFAGGSGTTYASFAMDAPLRRMIRVEGEGQRLELKASALNDRGGKPELAPNIAKSVAAFMNSAKGGTVVVGVADDRTVVGIEDEYARVNAQAANWDGYQMWLSSKLSAAFDMRTPFDFFDLNRFVEDGHDVCVIYVKPSAMPVFLGGGTFYVRDGAMNRPQTGHDLLSFCFRRWRNPVADTLALAETPASPAALPVE